MNEEEEILALLRELSVSLELEPNDFPQDESWSGAPVRLRTEVEIEERWTGEKSYLEADLRARSKDTSKFKNKEFQLNQKNLFEMISSTVKDLMICDDFLDTISLLEFHSLMLLPREHLQPISRHLGATNSGNKDVITHAILNKRYIKWSLDISNFPSKRILFTGESEARPSDILLNAIKEKPTTANIFHQYITKDMLKSITKFTNEKAKKLQEIPKPNWCKLKHWPPKYLKNWYQLTVDELIIWMAILFARTSIGRGISASEFWNTHNLFDYSKINNKMSRDRWNSINSCLCIYDPSKDPIYSDDSYDYSDNEINLRAKYVTETGNQPYYKGTDFIDVFASICRKNFIPGKHISRDEQCVRNNHHTSLRHFRMPKKYVANGIRIECLTTPDGVMLDFLADIPNVTYEKKALELIKRLKTKGHILYMDRLYTSKIVIDKALLNDQYVCGTVSKARFPNSLLAGDLETGEYRYLSNGKMVAYTWQDSGKVNLFSSYHSPQA